MIPELRDYQEQCLNTILTRYKAGIRRQLICLPTGTGKTIIFASFPGFFRMKNKMLVLAHREELLIQARDKIIKANPGLKVEIEQAGRRADPACDVVVASVPTIGRKDSSRMELFNPDDFYLVVVDEAHHAIGSTYQRIFKQLRLLDPGTKKLLVGFTATPKRGDGVGLNRIFEEITFSRTLPEMIAAHYLSPLSGYRVETEIDLSGVKKHMGDYITSQLSKTVNVRERNDLVVNIYRKYLDNQQTICFCVDVAHTYSLAGAFTQSGIPVAPVTGEMDIDQRKKALDDFSAGNIKVLTNCMVLTEGYDESSVSGIILARPTRSSLLYTQMIGRATRLHPGKKQATIIDIVDITKDHGLITLPSLFGFSDTFNLEGNTTDQVQEALQWVEQNRPWVRTDLTLSLSDLRIRCKKINLYELKLPPELRLCATLAWTAIGNNLYSLNLLKGEAMTVASTILGKWDVIFRSKGKEEIIASKENVREAIRTAERFVANQRMEVLGLVKIGTRWRKQPATDKQLSLLKEKGIEIPQGLTKGQASHIISMFSLSHLKKR
ncbi:MAG: DEAD/DEAH box helicase [Spirochaetales bacterium]|nr:DEAD/DEAH box helicase [Spirochaetales bacterium]